jgi:hypothetical protein
MLHNLLIAYNNDLDVSDQIWEDLAPNISVYVPNEIHDFITNLSKQYKAIPSFASITIRCASDGSNPIPKCVGEYYAVLNEFEEISGNYSSGPLCGDLG